MERYDNHVMSCHVILTTMMMMMIMLMGSFLFFLYLVQSHGAKLTEKIKLRSNVW